jgi:hypothetical protein
MRRNVLQQPTLVGVQGASGRGYRMLAEQFQPLLLALHRRE